MFKLNTAPRGRGKPDIDSTSLTDRIRTVGPQQRRSYSGNHADTVTRAEAINRPKSGGFSSVSDRRARADFLRPTLRPRAGHTNSERTGVAKLWCVQREVAVAIAGRKSPSRTHTLGLDCDWRLMKR